MKKLLSAALALLMALSMLTACGSGDTVPEEASGGSEDEVLTLRTCTQSPDTNINTIVTRYFAERVSELSEGKMEIEVYINAELGSEQSVMEQVLTGTLEMAPISTSLLANVVPETGIYSLPFLFPTMELSLIHI